MIRLLAICRACRHAPDRPITDALLMALENSERLARAYHHKRRPVPLNEELPDEPGEPGKRRPIKDNYEC